MSFKSVQFTVGQVYVNLDRDQMTSFLNDVKKAGKAAIDTQKNHQAITALVTETFNDSTVQMDVSSTKQVMEDLKEKISVFEESSLTQLFKETLEVVNTLAASDSQLTEKTTAKTFPYMGVGSLFIWEDKLEDTDPGTYAVFSDFVNPEVKVVVVRIGNHPILDYSQISHYSLEPDQENPGGYKVIMANAPSKVERFNSIEEFIENKTNEGILKQPYPLEPFNFDKIISGQLKSKPYFNDIDLIAGIEMIASRKPGSYLIRDKENDPNAKVFVYMDQSGDINKFELIPRPGLMKGYDCNGKWFPDINHFEHKYKHLFTSPFLFSLEEIEARQEREAIPQSLEVQAGPPQWKTGV